VGWLLYRIALASKEILSEGVENIRTKYHIVHDLGSVRISELHYGNVHMDDFELVRLRDLQRRLQNVNKFGQGLVLLQDKC